MIFPLEELVKFKDNIYEITTAASRRAYQLSMVKDPIIEENDGKVVSILDDVNTLVETINDSNPEKYEGQTFYYTEDRALYLETLDKDGSELPICLTINDYGIATNHNISIGSFRDDVIAAYGEPNVEPNAVFGPDGNQLSKEEVIEQCGEELIYNLGDITITFLVTDGFVSSITYTHNANHDKFSWS